MTSTIPETLLSLLRDPVGLGPLELKDDFLIGAASQRKYSIVDSIPILFDENPLGPQNTRIQKMYQWMSKGFDLADRIGNLFTRGAIIKLRRQLSEGLGIKPGDRCLYTSIGTGLDLPFLAERTPLDQIELVGLDLSMGMLRQCKKKLRGHENTSMLVQGNAERLPFADESFDVVFHVGGINLFDRPTEAVAEMVRVAKAGAPILYADETSKVVKNHYQGNNPFTRGACKGISTNFDPREWVPAGIRDFTYETVWNGKGYFLSFRKPSSENYTPA